MSILIYTHEYPPFKGGIATSTEKIAKILSIKHQVYVCCPTHGISNIKDIELKNLMAVKKWDKNLPGFWLKPFMLFSYLVYYK